MFSIIIYYRCVHLPEVISVIPEILEGEEATPVQHPGDARIGPSGWSKVTLTEGREGLSQELPVISFKILKSKT
jgi:hypothetical protein